MVEVVKVILLEHFSEPTVEQIVGHRGGSACVRGEHPRARRGADGEFPCTSRGGNHRDGPDQSPGAHLGVLCQCLRGELVPIIPQERMSMW